MFVYLMLFFLFGTAFANADCSVCPESKPVENIDWNTFLSGDWYEYYRYKCTWEVGMKCVTIKFKEETNEFNVTAVKDKKSASIDGYFTHHNDKGIVVICSDTLFENTGAACLKINIVDIKYGESMLLYGCRQDENTGEIQEYAWGFTRKTTMDETTRNRVEKSFNSTSYIDPSRFEFPGHSEEDCCID